MQPMAIDGFISWDKATLTLRLALELSLTCFLAPTPVPALMPTLPPPGGWAAEAR